MKVRRLFATDFGLWPTFDSDHVTVAKQMLAVASFRENLANYLLLYDQIVIPTGNFVIISVLRQIFGEAFFEQLIHEKVIVLARFDTWFGYVGNGAGLGYVRIHPPHGTPKNEYTLSQGFFQPLDSALGIALRLTKPISSSTQASRIQNFIFDNVIELPAKDIVDGLADESYRDILSSPYLMNLLCIRNNGREISNLQGIGPNVFRYLNPYRKNESNPEIDAVLRVAFENFILAVGGHLQATDIAGDAATLSVLRGKGQRYGFSIDGNAAFTQIQQLHAVPNIGKAFSSGQLSVSDLIRLRNSPNCASLRRWLENGTRDSTQEILSKYVETLGKPSWLDHLPVKAIRLAATTGFGEVGPLTGAVASLVDTFFLAKWFPIKSPRLFMREAKNLLLSKPVVEAPIRQGRNELCRCGSGKKYKKCHGL